MKINKSFLAAINIHSAIFPLFCALPLFFCPAGAWASSPSSNSDSSVVKLANDVSSEMLNFSFWISRVKKPFKVKMSREEIARWNRENQKISLSAGNFYISNDLRKFDSVISSAELRSQLLRYKGKVKWFKKLSTKNVESQRELGLKDWHEIYDAMNYSKLGTFNYFSGGNLNSDEYEKDFPVRKAICVKRTDMRLVPDSTFYTDDENYWYDDIAQNSGILMNEPVLVLWESKDGDWLFVKSSFCTGWVRANDLAFCSDDEFLRYFDYAEKSPESFVTITEERFNLPSDYTLSCADEEFSGFPEFFMGTFLFTANLNQQEDVSGLFCEREPHSSFLVEIPYRKKDGSLAFAYASIPSGKCSLGLLDYTTANVLNLAFKSLGVRYGWGGMADSRDCSEYLKDIFRCFGFNLARNSRSQLAMAGKTVDFEKKSLSSKKSALSSLEPGTLMGFPGHVFMYLGKVDGKHYVISALGAYYREDEQKSDTGDKLLKINANSVSINTVDEVRKNGKTWLEMLTQAKLFKDDGSWEDERIPLNPKWQFASFSKINFGSSILYRAPSNRTNIVVALNAGHGTKDGSPKKTYSHPDKSPKVTGGTNAAGAVMSTSVSDGMIFNDGKTEAEVTLRTARILKNILLKKGYDVLMIRDSSNTQLDNVARTVIANNNAKIHVAIHFDKDNKDSDKGSFFCSVPDGIKYLPNVKKHWQKSDELGECLIQALENNGFPIYDTGRMDIDLTQTSFSTIPTVDIEIGNQFTSTTTPELKKRAAALAEGIENFLKSM